jgi:hypothetical protein
MSCSNKTLEITLSGEQLRAFYDTLREDREDIMASLCVIDVEQATSYLPEDRDRIFEVIRSKGGFHSFNVSLVGLLRDWVAKAARKLVLHPTAAADGVEMTLEEPLKEAFGEEEMKTGKVEAYYPEPISGRDLTRVRLVVWMRR